MDSGTIAAMLGGVLAGGLLAAVVGALLWGRKLSRAKERISKLDHASQFAEQQNAQVRKQVEHLQREVTDLRTQLSRSKPRQEVSTSEPTRQEAEDLLLRQPAPEAFAATQILPRQSPSDGFPRTQVLPRKR